MPALIWLSAHVNPDWLDPNMVTVGLFALISCFAESGRPRLAPQ